MRAGRPGVLTLAVALLAGAATAASAEEPFEIQAVSVSGRPVQAVVADLAGRGEGHPRDLLVISVSGVPPNEVRRLSVFPGDGDGVAARPARTLEIPQSVIAFDVGPVDATDVEQLVLLDGRGLELLRPLATPPARRRVDVPGLLVPARTRELSRLPMLDDWNADGTPLALLPTLDGARLVSLAGAPTRRIGLPIVSEYWTTGWENPPQYGFLSAGFDWPILARADDDGDGRPDLFALSRFGVHVHRVGEAGLPEQPTRRMAITPFSPEDEMRFQATELQMFARDLDADGLADVVVHSTSGRLVNSHAETVFHRNGGSGVDVAGSGDHRVDLDGAIASVDLSDLDGDGRVEIVQGALRFGVLQAVRALVQRAVEAEIRVLSFGANGGPPVVTWEGLVSVGLDFDAGRVSGLLPRSEGDWNGDGLRDLILGPDATTLEIKLGARGSAGPGFDGPGVTLSVPKMDLAVIAELTGDGLVDLVLFDPRDESGRVHVLRNRGTLPGTPAERPARGTALIRDAAPAP